MKNNFGPSKRAKKPEVRPCDRPMHVAPMGRCWVLVEGLGVISMHRLKKEAEAELRRRRAQKSPLAPPPPEEPPPGSIDEGGSDGAVAGAS